MSSYLALKLVHIVSASVLFGTGLGTAWFMWRAVRSGDMAAVRVTARNVIAADWLFTAPAVLVQPVTGVLLMLELDYRFDSLWFLTVVSLYVLVGACWMPVVFLQYRLLAMAQADTRLSPRFHTVFGIWRRLGYGAFAGVLALFVLMIFRPGL